MKMVYLSGLSVFQHTPAPTEIGQVDHKGAYSENMFCVVLLKSVFFLTFRVFGLRTLHLLAYQVRVTASDSGLCHVRETSFGALSNSLVC